MKKLLTLFLIVASTIYLYAIPAYPEKIEFTQPDGSKIFIFLKGDEKVHWAETLDGYTLIFNEKGFYEYAQQNAKGDLEQSGIIAQNIEKRNVQELNFLKNTSKHLIYSKNQIEIMKQIWDVYEKESNNYRDFPTTGERKLICILIGFQDIPFTLQQSDFNSLFNQVNYTYDNATGSVKDYYLEVSYNQFNLTVDIAGPYQASENRAYYGAPGGDPRQLTAEAINFADADVDFSQYDNDLDGWVDGVYIIFAGHGEEAGAPSEAIWSHAWSLASAIQKDGVWLQRYSCSPEFRGSSGTSITRIGVICHEFGHVLGAPDFYDTDYETGGQFSGTGKWDMMANGSWNNNGATPAHHNGVTKSMIYGWASPTYINTPQNVLMYNAVDSSNSFYLYETSTTDEYFFLENREKHKFDAYIPGSGMIIYHIHKNIYNVGNSINATHPQMMYPVAQNATQDPTSDPTSYGTINSSSCAWNGENDSKTSFTDISLPSSKSWTGQNTNKPITGISRNSTEKTVSFVFMGGNNCNAPTTNSSNISVNQTEDEIATINWANGNGDAVLVIAKKGSQVNAIPLNGQAYIGDSFFGNGDEIASENFVVYNGNSSNMTIAGLLPATEYFLAIYDFNTAENCYNLTPTHFSFTTSGEPLCSMCNALALNDDDRGITNVTINSIDNSSDGSPKYSDFRNIFTNVNVGETYQLSVKVNTNGNYSLQTKVWIDWNKNCTFENNEAYDLGTATNVSDGLTLLSPLSITIPDTVTSGRVTMRIRTRYNSAPTACNYNSYSEAEDYILKVYNPNASKNENLVSTYIFPNPTKNILNIQLNNKLENSTYEIMDINGKKILNGILINNFSTINIENLNSGIYFLKIHNNLDSKFLKFVVE